MTFNRSNNPENFDAEMAALQEYFILNGDNFAPLLNYIGRLPPSIQKQTGGRGLIFKTALQSNNSRSKPIIQQYSSINNFLQNQEISQTVTKTNTQLNSLTKQENKLREKVDDGFREVANAFSLIEQKLQQLFDALQNFIDNLPHEDFVQLIEAVLTLL